MALQRTAFEKGEPGIRGLALHAVVAGACLIAMVDAQPSIRWAGVALLSGGFLSILLSNSAWMSKPFLAGLFGEAVVYRDMRSNDRWNWLFGPDRSIGWCLLVMTPGIPLGMILAHWLGFELDLSVASVLFLFGGMLTSAAIGIALQTFAVFSRYVVVQFDAPLQVGHAAGSMMEQVARTIPLAYASLVADERSDKVRVYALVARSAGVESVRKGMHDGIVAAGLRQASPILVSALPDTGRR